MMWEIPKVALFGLEPSFVRPPKGPKWEYHSPVFCANVPKNVGCAFAVRPRTFFDHFTRIWGGWGGIGVFLGF